MKIRIEWKNQWGMLGTVVFCHWLALAPAPALDEDAPAASESPEPPLPPGTNPDKPPATPDPSVLPTPNVIPNVIPVVPVPNAPDEPGLPGEPGMPGMPDEPGATGEAGEALKPGSSDRSDTSDESDTSDATDDSDNFFTNLAGFPLAGEFGDSVAAGLSFTTTLSGTYDSNVTQGWAQTTSTEPTDDFFLSLAGNLNYLSRPSTFTFGGNYRGRYDEYLTRSEFSGYSQGGGLVANYKAARFTLSATAGIDANRGSPQNYGSSLTYGGTPTNNYNQDYNRSNFNRLNQSGSLVGTYGGNNFSLSASVGIDMDQGSNDYSTSASTASADRTSFHSSLSGSYRLSGKTTLTGSIGQSTSTGNGTYGDTNSYNIGTAAMWRYSPRTQIGPGIRYSYTSGDSGYGNSIYSGSQGRSSIGPTLNVNYELSKKVSLTSSVGLDFAQYDGGQSADPAVSGSLALNYQASVMWGMNLALSRNVNADPTSGGGFYESNSLRLGYHHKIRRAAFNLGMSYANSSATGPTGLTGGRPDSNMLSFDTSLGMPVFANRANASVFLRYNNDSGVYTGQGTTSSSWDSFQAGFSLSYGF